MAPNDVVIVRFSYPDEPDRHDLGFGHVQAVIAQLQQVLEAAARLLLNPKGAPAFEAILVANPRKGSLEIVLQFPLVVEIAGNAYTQEIGSLLKSDLTTAAELAAVGTFVLEVVLRLHGAVAKVTRQDKPPNAEPEDELQAKYADAVASSVLEEIRSLTTVAYNTGTVVDIELRDYGRIYLNPPEYRRLGVYIGQHRHGPAANLSDQLDVELKGAEPTPVRYKDGDYWADFAHLPNGRTVVLLSPLARQSLPPGHLIVRASQIPDLQHVHAVSDLPAEFGHAEGAFIVSTFAVWQS